MFPITTFDGGRRSSIDESAEVFMASTVSPRAVCPVEPRPSEVENREQVDDPEHEAVLTWSETIERTAATELILHT